MARPRPRRDGAWASLAVLVAAGLCCCAVYLQSARSLRAEVIDHILQLSCAASVVVDGDLHPMFLSREQENGPEYARAIRPMADFLSVTPNLRFLYTFVQHDGNVYLVLDPSPPGDNDHDGVDDKAHVMEPYPGTDAMRRTLAENRPVAESEPSSDQWGTFMSAYAPIRDSAGRQVGAIGVDVSMESYHERLAGVRKALTIGLAIAAGLSMIVGLVVWRLRRAALRAQETIVGMIDELRTARDAADSAARLNAEFLADMSHEIRNPMNAILGLSDLLIETGPPPEMREDLELIRRSGKTLLGILNDVLDVSKLEAGKFTLRQEPVDPRALASDTIRLFTPIAGEHGTELGLHVNPSVPARFLGDPMRIGQIIANLVSNALKFTDGGSVSLIVDRSPDRPGWIRFRVADTGIGIPEDLIERVFDKFMQASTPGSAQLRGTGLGLNIARSLVELMGGSIAATSRIGEGSTFTVAIPLVPAEDDAAEPGDAPGKDSRAA